MKLAAVVLARDGYEVLRAGDAAADCAGFIAKPYHYQERLEVVGKTLGAPGATA